MRSETRQAPRAVAARWTPLLARAGWTPVADFFLESYHRLRITHTEAMLVIHLLMHKWDQNAPFPAIKTLARRMGISATAARHHARSLEKKGYLKRVKQIGTTNRFQLEPLFTALENLLIEDYAQKKVRESRLGGRRQEAVAAAVEA